ncbi:dienelactone hydrolase family protein [Planctomyces sp. SH-PL62]|uniref:dienelactone hydrolase family protein n=1 Tax=Planctomyces sp. SH-PL62 TaxID=1636152 RepID=UPI00078B3D2B|nr:alpha/beta hydrolase [Planctomyces sp. SH-PL62]AMV38858.1 Alpha/beta hydrolase family protein [Planctomyces sp. SH-PL62]
MNHTLRIVAASALALILNIHPDAIAGEPNSRPTRGKAEESPPPHGRVARHEMGTGPRSYLLYEPADPKPERAPVVVFLHGWFSVNPAIYGAWIDHLVRNGSTVVFPRYQNNVGTLPRDFLPNALHAVRDALVVLEGGRGHVRPEPGKFALIGHSAGGNLAAQLAALSANPRHGLPEVKATLAFFPGEVLPTREPLLSEIPASTLLVVAVGEEDVLVGDLRGRQIFAQATSVPRSRKRYLLFRSDRHGFPPLIAEHTAPSGANPKLDNGEGILRNLQLSMGEVNALDRAGFWRVADQTLEAAYAGRTLDEAAADSEAFTNLGYWSDGRKVLPPLMADHLDAVPRVILSNGIRLIPWEWPVKATDPPRSQEGETAQLK